MNMKNKKEKNIKKVTSFLLIIFFLISLIFCTGTFAEDNTVKNEVSNIVKGNGINGENSEDNEDNEVNEINNVVNGNGINNGDNTNTTNTSNTNTTSNNVVLNNVVSNNVISNNIVTNEINNNENKITNNTVTNTTKNEFNEENNKKTLNVSAAEYAGTVYIDTPTQNQNCMADENGKITIKGWAVSNDKKASLRLYVNDWLWAGVSERTVRSEVSNSVGKTYGGLETTPKAGFTKELDVSTFDEGIHKFTVEQVASNGKIIGKYSTTIKLSKKKYTGTVYIDTPIQNQNCMADENGKITIKGWAVSNDKKASLRLYVNDWLWAGVSERTVRSEVSNSVGKTYGGLETTPKAGFTKELDVSTFKEGTHKFTVEQISRSGAVIGKYSTTIKLSKKKYAGTVCIDTPTQNQNCMADENGKITIKGWAVSNDKKASLRLYVNDWLWAGVSERTVRSEVSNSVGKTYGGLETTPKAGFTKELDVSSFTDGIHKFTIEQVSRDGKVIGRYSTTIRLSKKKYAGTIYVDSPVNNSSYNIKSTSKIQIKGWAVSNDARATIFVSVDNNFCKYSATRTIRTEVSNSVGVPYGGIKTNPRAGYVVDLDISTLKDGKHIIGVMEVSSRGEVLDNKQLTINVATPGYKGLINIDSPVRNRRYPSGIIYLKGWAVTDADSDYVDIYLDGKYLNKAVREKRSDVFDVYKSSYGLKSDSQLGFISNIFIGHLSEGIHKIKVVQCSKYGKAISSQEVSFMLSNSKFWGIDVSHHNGSINWDAVRSTGVNFAILKIGEYRESQGVFYVDSKFNENYNQCKARGIDVGGYVYSYEFNPTEAAHEAEACLQNIRGKSFELPIFLDIEDNIIRKAIDTGRTNVTEVTNGAITFCNIMNQNGYKSGVYANKVFFSRYLNVSVLENYNIWLANYVTIANNFPVVETDYGGKYDLWQYTSSGNLPGISGNIDLNWSYRRYY